MKSRYFTLSFLSCCSLLLVLDLWAGTGEVETSPDRQTISLDMVLEPLGKNVKTFVEELQETACLEKVVQRVLRRNGKVRNTRVALYEYLFTVAPTKYGISVEEMRRPRHRSQGSSDTGFMITNGFPAAVLIFHPDYIGDFEYQFVGQEKLGDRDTLVLSFRQNPNRMNRLFWFRTRDKSWPVYMRGKAWVDSTSFQVVALATEMLEPNKQAGLLTNTTHIEYKAVFFKRRKKLFWVPNRIQVQLAWRGRVFQNEHIFSDFMSFEVDTKQVIRPPEGSEDEKP